MNEVSLVARSDEFLRKGFSFDEAYDLLGPARRTTGGGAIVLTPRPGGNIEQAALEQFNPGPNGPPFLAGMSVRFTRPVQVDFEELSRRFGPEMFFPRADLGEDVHYLFDLKGEDYDGTLILDVPDPSSLAKRLVTGQILRRFPGGDK
jgi:hypothetical protein